MKILIVTNEIDSHASAVIEELYQRVPSESVFRLNTEMLLRKNAVTVRQSSSGTDFTLMSKGTSRSVDGREISAVYYRRPEVVFPLVECLGEHAGEVASKESTLFIDWMMSSLDIDTFVLSPPHVLRRANSKLLQYRIATQVGLQLPKTLYSNDRTAVAAFVDSIPAVAVKTLREASFIRGEKSYSFFTRRVSSDDLRNFIDNAPQSINYFQEYVEKQYELRVTAVRDQLFSVRINSQNATEKSLEDWRREDFRKVPHLVEPLPKSVKNSVLEFLSRMNLSFGCFDFIVDPDGEYWFLECNPNGQWLWIQELTGVNIAGAVADALVAGGEGAGNRVEGAAL